MEETSENLDKLFNVKGMKADADYQYNKPKTFAIESGKNEYGSKFLKDNSGKLITKQAYISPNTINKASKYSTGEGYKKAVVDKKPVIDEQVKVIETKIPEAKYSKLASEIGKYGQPKVADENLKSVREMADYAYRKKQREKNKQEPLAKKVDENAGLTKSTSSFAMLLNKAKKKEPSVDTAHYTQKERIKYGDEPIGTFSPKSFLKDLEIGKEKDDIVNSAYENLEKTKKDYLDSNKLDQDDVAKAKQRFDKAYSDVEEFDNQLDEKMASRVEGDKNKKLLKNIGKRKTIGEEKELGDEMKAEAQKEAKIKQGALRPLVNKIAGYRIDKNLPEKEKNRKQTQIEGLSKLLDTDFEDLSPREKIDKIGDLKDTIRKNDLDLNGEYINALNDIQDKIAKKIDRADKYEEKRLNAVPEEITIGDYDKGANFNSALTQNIRNIQNTGKPFDYKKFVDDYNEYIKKTQEEVKDEEEKEMKEEEKEEAKEDLFNSYSTQAAKIAWGIANSLGITDRDQINEMVQESEIALNSFLNKAEPIKEGESLGSKIQSVVSNAARSNAYSSSVDNELYGSRKANLNRIKNDINLLKSFGIKEGSDEMLLELGYLDIEKFNNPKTSEEVKDKMVARARNQFQDDLAAIRGKKYSTIRLDKKIEKENGEEDDITIGDLAEDKNNERPDEEAYRKRREEGEKEIADISNKLIEELPYGHGKVLAQYVGFPNGVHKTSQEIADEYNSNPNMTFKNINGDIIDHVTAKDVDKVLAGVIRMLKYGERGKEAKKVYDKYFN